MLLHTKLKFLCEIFTVLFTLRLRNSIKEVQQSQICSKKNFRRLLLKVITECLFQLKQIIQTECCSMGSPLSVPLADIQQKQKMT